MKKGMLRAVGYRTLAMCLVPLAIAAASGWRGGELEARRSATHVQSQSMPSRNRLLQTSPDITGRFEGADRILVTNIGLSDTGPFRMAVLAGANSYSIQDGGLAAGEQRVYTLKGFDCHQYVSVILDVDNQARESEERNNVVSFYASCRIDPGTNLKPAED